MGEGGNEYACADLHMQEFRITNMQIEKEDRHMNRVMRITRAPYQGYVLNTQEKKKEDKKVVMNTKPNTNDAALATQLERLVEKKTYTYDAETGKQTRNGLGGHRGYYW